ncbi:MAG: efflux RND transporter periplasmic adaptor subunit [Acidobacteriota bacterium]
MRRALAVARGSNPSRLRGLLLLLLAGPGLFFGCAPGGGESGPDSMAAGEHDEHDDRSGESAVLELAPEMLENVSLETTPVERRVLLPELETTGRVGFDEERLVHVAPRVPGRIERVYGRLGDEVRSGQALAVIDSVELGLAQAEYLEARAAESLARRNLEREKGLRAEKISSEKDYLAALAAHEEARARLGAARETLRLYGLADGEIDALEFGRELSSLLTVRAPAPGRIVERHAAVGELVGPDVSIFTVADIGKMWIWIDVYERDLRHVHRGDLVLARVDAWPGEEFSGKVAYLSDMVDQDTRTVRARLDVANRAGRLRAGMFARVRISDPHARAEAEHAEPVLVVPRSAIQRSGEGEIVFVRVGETSFERRVVRTGTRAGGLVAVLAGLEEGEPVVVRGAFLLKSEVSKDELEPEHGH